MRKQTTKFLKTKETSKQHQVGINFPDILVIAQINQS